MSKTEKKDRPFVAALRCEVCGAEQPCPKEQVEAYTQHGFPKHCDVTMKLFVEGS